MTRNNQLDLLLGAAMGLTGDNAETVALIVGTLMIACALSNDPIAVFGIAIDSLTKAKQIAEATVAKHTAVVS